MPPAPGSTASVRPQYPQARVENFELKIVVYCALWTLFSIREREARAETLEFLKKYGVTRGPF